MNRRILFNPKARAEFDEWKLKDKKKAMRIYDLLKDIAVSPFEGIGKPEPLKHNLHGYWSRRIDKVNRLVYQISDDAIIVISCAHHYER